MLIAFLTGFVAGVALQLQQATLWQALSYMACTALALAGLATLGLWARCRSKIAVFMLAALLMFALTGWRAASYLQTTIRPALEGQDLAVVGVVSAMPLRLETGLRFRFEVEAAYQGDQSVTLPPRLLLSWYKREANDDGTAFNLEDAALQPRAGERWQFTVRLKAPHGNVNPHGFDYELWMWEQGAGASGYVRESRRQAAQPSTVPKRVGRVEWSAAYSMERWRGVVRDQVFQRLGSGDARPAAGVIAALVAGDQAAIERADWDVFRASGVAHLMSISGLHITMFAWLASLLVSRAWRRSVRLCLTVPAAHAGVLGGLALATLYAWFSGWGVPAQRTIWMLAAFSFLRLVGLRWPWYATWLLAAVVVLTVDPWALLQAGFWLSFVAVAVLFASDAAPARLPQGADPPKPKLKLSAPVWAALREQWIITLALAPLTLVLFQQLSLVSLLANALAIPLVTLLVTPLSMLGVLWQPWWDAAAWVIALQTDALRWLTTLPYAVYTAPAPPLWVSAPAVLGAVLMVVPLYLVKRWQALSIKALLAMLLFTPWLLWQPSRPAMGQLGVMAIDIGQGNAVLIQTAHHSLLFDAGPRFSRESDEGHRTIVPLLRALGVKLDVLMLSHKDSDHTGGAKAVLAAHPQASVMTSVTLPQDLAALGLPSNSQPCYAGQTWRWDEVLFEVLHPAQEDLNPEKKLKPNAIACVLKVTGALSADRATPASILLTADIEAREEAALVSAQLGRLPSTVLLVPHHGSKTSSSEAFLDAVNPKLAMVQAGYRNRFTHPRPEVMARYEQRSIPTVLSSSCGAAIWRSDTPDEVMCQRHINARYWRHQPR